MPLDPQVQAFLNELESFRAPALRELTPAEARAALITENAMLGPPEPVARVEDRRIPGPGGEISLRIYTPRDEGALPVLVYFHGGGWVVGDVTTHDGACRAIANAAECTVVSADYRLAPENKFPAAVEDAFAATAWVFEHPGDFGGQRRRIAVGGDSAGATLATVVAMMARDRSAFAPVFQVLIYPVVDYNLDTPSYHANGEGYLLTREDMRWFWDCYLRNAADGDDPRASPLRAADLGNLPPALVITAEYDPLRDEGEAYASRLREAGVPTQLTRYHGMIHGFIRRTNLFDRARTAVEEIAGALKHAFG